MHYDQELELVETNDTSSYRVGAVSFDKMPTTEERPIAFLSRSLSAAERNYSQIDKEALSCSYALKWFHSYMYGHHLTLQIDHKPLLTLCWREEIYLSSAGH